MSGNSSLRSEAIDTHQASTCIGMDALASRLLLVAGAQDRTYRLCSSRSVVSVKFRRSNGRGQKSNCVMRMELKANPDPMGAKSAGLGG